MIYSYNNQNNLAVFELFKIVNFLSFLLSIILLIRIFLWKACKCNTRLGIPKKSLLPKLKISKIHKVTSGHLLQLGYIQTCNNIYILHMLKSINQFFWPTKTFTSSTQYYRLNDSLLSVGSNENAPV